jgi:hypothetical protein
VFPDSIPEKTMLMLAEIDPEEGERLLHQWIADSQRAAAESAAEAVEKAPGNAAAALELREQFLPGTGHATNRQLKGSPDQVQAAAAAWAGYSGWFPVTTDEGAPVYRWGRFVRLSGNIQMKVVCQPRRGSVTDTQFVLGARRGSGPSRVPHQMWIDACEYFSDGVAQELSYELLQLPPDAMERWGRKRDTRRVIERITGATFVWLPAALLPAGILVGLLTGSALWGVATGSWLFTLWLLDGQLRMRAIGMRLARGFVAIGVLLVPLAVMLTAFAAAGGH